MRSGSLRFGVLIGSGLLVLSACSSSAESEVTATVTPSPTVDEAVVAVLAEDACFDYFAIDLIRSDINGDPSALKKKQRQARLAELQLAVDQMVVSIDAAVIGGELPANALTNAERIQNNVNKANANRGIAGFNKKQIKRINTSAERIERFCVAAGNDLPTENIDARSS